MSIHKSLKSSQSSKSKRTVHKRWERMRSLMLQKKFDSGQSVWGLPKEKIVKYKIKKDKKEEKEKSLVEIAQENKKDKSKKQSKDVGKIK